MEDAAAVQKYLDSYSHENLAEEMMQDIESDTEEYTQEFITAVQLRNMGWIDIKMGTFEIAFGDAEGEVQWEAELVTGGFESGFLSDITGFKSLE